MGSLMAGWDSPVQDPKSVQYRRNWSFTKGEIDAYWKLKKKTEEEHLRAISSPSDRSQDGPYENHETKFQRSSSLPPANTKAGFMDMKTDRSVKKISTKNDWWTRSSWAFLNETPVLEPYSNTYAPQFHIANIATSKANTGIST